jgi:hypothetical protein
VLLRLYRLFRFHRIESAGLAPEDCLKLRDYLMLTASNALQAQAYESQLQARRERDLPSQVREAFVVPDLEGKRRPICASLLSTLAATRGVCLPAGHAARSLSPCRERPRRLCHRRSSTGSRDEAGNAIAARTRRNRLSGCTRRSPLALVAGTSEVRVEFDYCHNKAWPSE